MTRDAEEMREANEGLAYEEHWQDSEASPDRAESFHELTCDVRFAGPDDDTLQCELPRGHGGSHHGTIVFTAPIGPVLGECSHGVDLDRQFCPHGCRV